jgi:hypothetical protein
MARLDIPPDRNPRQSLDQVPTLLTAEYGPSPLQGNPWRKAVLILQGREVDIMYFIAD